MDAVKSRSRSVEKGLFNVIEGSQGSSARHMRKCSVRYMYDRVRMVEGRVQYEQWKVIK